ncbi:MAG: hypothetical protein AAF492_28240, partial [Verrucomicrobiota bacterium]
MKTGFIPLLCAFILPASAQIQTGPDLVYAIKGQQEVAAVIRQPADYISMPIFIHGDKKDA